VLPELITLPEGATIQGQNGERFVVEGLLATGGFSVIYRVHERRARDKLYALKVISNPTSSKRRHLTFEGEILKRLEHRSLPHIYQLFENTRLSQLYILMEYIEGQDLETLRLKQPEKHFSLSLTLVLMKSIVEAVSYLHNQQPPIVHRDIKPANIIVPNGIREPKLVDFGLAKEYAEENTTNIIRYGTPGYAAVEQYGQGTNPRTDLYALAATIYTLLSGIVPIDALTRNLEHHTEDPLLPLYMLNQAIPIPVSDVIEKAMSLRSEDRYASVEEFWQVINSASMQELHTGPIVSDPQLPALAVAGDPKLGTYKLEKQADKFKERLSNRPTHSMQGRIYVRKKLLRSALYVLLTCVILAVGIGSFFLFAAWPRHDTTTYEKRAATNVATPTINVDPIQGCPKEELLQLAIGSSGDYPQLARCYGGTIQDSGIDGGSGPALIYDIHQQESNISGEFHGLGMVGTFAGNLKLDGTLQFVVTPLGGSRSLLFKGHIRPGGTGHIVATFNDLDQNNRILTNLYGNCTLIASATPSTTPTASSGS
jgi:serine/threonine protein kinase